MKYTIEQQKEGAELVKTLSQKAWKSPTFKKQLIKSPVTTIEQVIGKNLSIPNNMRVVVEDQTDDSIIYLNIPAKVNLDELELTEEQLELVAGGATPLFYAAGFVVGLGVCWLLDTYT